MEDAADLGGVFVCLWTCQSLIGTVPTGGRYLQDLISVAQAAARNNPSASVAVAVAAAVAAVVAAE
jgi:hypothetical protein